MGQKDVVVFQGINSFPLNRIYLLLLSLYRLGRIWVGETGEIRRV
jgi:hypothetical protein